MALPPCAAIESKKRHTEACRRHRDGNAQQETEDAPQAAAIAKCEAEPKNHDG
jgi:hypothetical protein